MFCCKVLVKDLTAKLKRISIHPPTHHVIGRPKKHLSRHDAANQSTNPGNPLLTNRILKGMQRQPQEASSLLTERVL